MLGFAELSTPAKAIISLALVLVLVVIAGLILRRIAGGKLKLPGQTGRARQPRLGIVDIFELDRQRQLILLRRDNVEHLVMIGGPNDVVVEASIVRASARTQAGPAVDMDSLTTPVPAETQAPRGVVAARVPEPITKADAAPSPRLDPVIPAVVTSSAQEATLPPQVGRKTTGVSGAGLAAATGSAAMGVAAAGVAASEMSALTQEPMGETSTGETSAPAPAIEASAPSVLAPSVPASVPPLAAPAEFEAELKRALGEAPMAPIVEPITSASRLKADPADLSEMARQLEEALKRPNSGVAPANTLARQETSLVTQGPVVSDTPEAPAATTTQAEPALELATVADAAAIEEALQADIAAMVEPMAQDQTPEEATQARDDLAAALEAELAKAVALDVPGPSPETDAHPFTETDEQATPPASSAATDRLDRLPTLEEELFAALTAADKKPPADTALPDMEAIPRPTDPSPTVEAASAAPQPETVPKAAKPGGVDPFSVEAIEAEFARLLNRTTTPKG